MNVRRRDDHEGVDRRVVDQRHRIGVVTRHVELRSDVPGEVACRIGHRDETRFGNAPGEIARVDATEPAEANQSDIEQRCHRPLQVRLS